MLASLCVLLRVSHFGLVFSIASCGPFSSLEMPPKRGQKRALEATVLAAAAASEAKQVAEAAALAQKKVLQNFKDFSSTEIDIFQDPTTGRTLRQQLHHDVLRRLKGELGVKK